ncbi:MAG: lysophospholipid acyltransferase family protein [Acutalibacteraceae bacterium]
METSKWKLSVLSNAVDACYKPEILFEDENVLRHMAEEPCVIICNHTQRTKDNFLASSDGLILRYVFEQQDVCSIVAKDILEKPLIKLASGGCGCIPIDRKSASIDWVHTCVARIREGSSVILFPEGTTLKEKTIDQFKPGFVLLAKMANVPVLPVAINGVYKPFTRGKLKIKIGRPMPLQCGTFTSEAMQAEVARFRQIVGEMYEEICPDNSQNTKQFVEV